MLSWKINMNEYAYAMTIHTGMGEKITCIHTIFQKYTQTHTHAHMQAHMHIHTRHHHYHPNYRPYYHHDTEDLRDN